jgi:glycosyltransferase involved in cell wall biosynthesis
MMSSNNVPILNTGRPKVSVCMATYNGSKYIRKQLLTILDQLLPGDEVVISDDSSVDDTVHIVQSINDPRIKLVTGQHFKSPIFNFENAIKYATAEYIFLSDQDDIWLPGKVDRMLESLRDHDVVFSNCYIVDADDNRIADSFFKVNHSGLGFFRNIIKNSYLGCCLAFNRKILKKALPFPKNIPMHDWWIGIVSEAFFRPTAIYECLMSYRRHGINATPTGERSNFHYGSRLRFRINLLGGLLKACFR